MNILDGLIPGGMKEGTGQPAPGAGIKRYFYILWNHFWKIAGLNLLFILFSIPVITIPAALGAVNRVCLKLFRDGNIFLWDDFREEFISGFRVNTLCGLVFAVLFFVSYYLLSLGLTNNMNVYGVLFNAGGLAVLLISAVWGGYFFVLSAMADQPAGMLIKNSFMLMTLGGGRTLCVLVTISAAVFFIVAVFPVSLLLFIICLPAVVQYTLCFQLKDFIAGYGSSDKTA